MLYEKRREICLLHFAFHPFIFGPSLNKFPWGMKGFIARSVSHFQLTHLAAEILNVRKELLLEKRKRREFSSFKKDATYYQLKMKKDAAVSSSAWLMIEVEKRQLNISSSSLIHSSLQISWNESGKVNPSTHSFFFINVYLVTYSSSLLYVLFEYINWLQANPERTSCISWLSILIFSFTSSCFNIIQLTLQFNWYSGVIQWR